MIYESVENYLSDSRQEFRKWVSKHWKFYCGGGDKVIKTIIVRGETESKTENYRVTINKDNDEENIESYFVDIYDKSMLNSIKTLIRDLGFEVVENHWATNKIHAKVKKNKKVVCTKEAKNVQLLHIEILYFISSHYKDL